MVGRLLIYATTKDWLLLLTQLEGSQEVRYGLDWQDRAAGKDPTWSSAAELPNLGVASGTQTLRCPHFKIFPKLPGGKDRIEADLWSGGELNSETIIAGTITTLYDDPGIQRIMRTLASLLKKHFNKVRAYWVGPEALAKFRSGCRLTLNIDASADFNLAE